VFVRIAFSGLSGSVSVHRPTAGRFTVRLPIDSPLVCEGQIVEFYEYIAFVHFVWMFKLIRLFLLLKLFIADKDIKINEKRERFKSLTQSRKV
jgi:hypothetical protein